MARKAPVFSSMCCRACGNRGTVWRDKPRLNIPGSIWLPDTGYRKLAAAAEEYLRRGIELASGGNNAALLVICCSLSIVRKLLDVLERGETHSVLRLFERGLVPRGNRRLGARQFTGRGFETVVASGGRQSILALTSVPARVAIPSAVGSCDRARITAGRSRWAPHRRI
jgi:hypothetical protein